MGTDHTLTADGLRKRYADLNALDGFDLHVDAGTIHGLLGPNGAGKSTAVKALTTLIDIDAGTARVAGFDVRTQSREVRRRIGLIGQHAAVDEILGGRQNLVMFGRLYGLSKADARARADELLDSFGLTAAADRAVSTYSGGMRRRLDIAAGLILTPAVLFLDEPTTGLDPRARSEVWDTVREIAGRGTTVLLTTQYLDEADQLLDTFGLTEAAARAVSTYSGGMRRRLDLAAGFILTPAVLFLDEPTTGLDPRARNEVWTSVREIAARGTTVLLTTQYLDEADQLAAQISVMNHGKVVASGTPDALKRQVGGDRVTVTVPLSESLESVGQRLSAAVGEPATVDAGSRRVTFEVGAGVVALADIVRALDELRIIPEDLTLRRPTLDEVFLTLTDKEAVR